MKELVIEYLLTHSEKDNGLYNLCKNKLKFIEIINSNVDFEIKKDKIIYQEKTYKFNLDISKSDDKKQRFFYFSINFDFEENKLDNYKYILRELKKTFGKCGFVSQTLRDDFTLYYSQEGYQLIHKIENQMRKFITYFMTIQIGSNWFKEISKNLEVINNNKKTKSHVLDTLNFDQLGNFLFNEYSTKNIMELKLKLKETKDIQELKLDEIREYIPSSNWDRYFKDVSTENSDYFKSKWDDLFSLRNDIAHNKEFGINELKKLKKVYDEVKNKLDEAFNDIDNIQINEDEKDEIKDNLDTSLIYKAIYKQFKITDRTKSLIEAYNIESPKRELSDELKALRDSINIKYPKRELSDELKALYEASKK